MARKLVVKSDAGEIWVIDVDDGEVRELTGDERDKMDESLSNAQNLIGVTNAALGDDLIEKESGHDKLK